MKCAYLASIPPLLHIPTCFGMLLFWLASKNAVAVTMSFTKLSAIQLFQSSIPPFERWTCWIRWAWFHIPYHLCMVYLPTCAYLLMVNVGRSTIHGCYGYTDFCQTSRCASFWKQSFKNIESLLPRNQVPLQCLQLAHQERMTYLLQAYTQPGVCIVCPQNLQVLHHCNSKSVSWVHSNNSQPAVLSSSNCFALQVYLVQWSSSQKLQDLPSKSTEIGNNFAMFPKGWILSNDNHHQGHRSCRDDFSIVYGSTLWGWVSKSIFY